MLCLAPSYSLVDLSTLRIELTKATSSSAATILSAVPCKANTGIDMEAALAVSLSCTASSVIANLLHKPD